MKCEVHPDQDALGTCVSCGRGVCAICKVNYQGTIHCKQCIEAGRIGGMRQPYAAPMYYPYGYGMPYPYPYYPYPMVQPRATPNPRGFPDGRLFKIGSAGSLLAGILSIVTGVAVLMDGGPFYFSAGSGAFTIGSSILFVIFQLMAAVGFYGFFHNYGPALSMLGAAALPISGIIYLLTIGLTYGNSQSSFFIGYGGVLALGVAQIIIGATIMDVRRFLDSRDMSSLAALMFVLGGGSMCALLGIFLIGWVLSAIGFMVLAVIMFTAPVPSPKTEGAEPEQQANYPPGAWPR